MYKNHIKRLLDIIVSLFALPFFGLLVLILAPFIYFADKGPIFYNAKRRGRNGKIYKMYKFRSMKVDSPDLRNADGSTYNSEKDTRVTKIGRIMRKTSLDELPQLLNIIKGDMSFVGPRPTLPGKKNMHEFDEKRLKRLEVRPGITGYSQAYFRNSIGQEQKFEYDAYYADNLTFVFDVKIFLKTVIAVLKKENVFVE